MPAPRTPRIQVRSRVMLLAATAVLAGWLTRAGAPAPTFVPGYAPADWPTTDGVGGAHHSPLGDITPATVRHLEVAWSYRTGDVSEGGKGRARTAFQATPIMVDGVLYLVTPFGRAVALDAETGGELWTFDPGLDRSDRHHGSVQSRGLSFWRDPAADAAAPCATRILLPVYDARLFALDAASGRPCPGFNDGEAIDLGRGVPRVQGRRHQYKLTAPPTVVGDLVVVGSSIYDSHDADAPSGVVRAFDVRSGTLRWSWEPLVGVGATLEDGSWLPAGAANTWATITADVERDLIFVPTGSPSPDHYGGLRPGDNRFANSVVALRASTGEVVWHFQVVHHDLWDYDLPSPPALVTVERDGLPVPAVVQSTKTGHLFVLHRETGEPLFPVHEVPVPASDVPGELASPTQPVPVLPRPLAPQGLGPDDAWGLTPLDRRACRRLIASMRHEGVFTPPSLRGSVAYPGFLGGMEWGGVAWDPASGLLVTNTNRLAMAATLIPTGGRDLPPAPEGATYSLATQRRTPYGVRREPLLSPLRIPCTPPPWGMLHAVDLNTGTVVWERPLGSITDLTRIPVPFRWGSPNLGGPLVAGGVVFIAATMDRRLRAFDLESGEPLWQATLPASAQSNPMTYRVRPGGRQFLVIAAGGHGSLGSTLGDHVVAFALPAPPASGEGR